MKKIKTLTLVSILMFGITTSAFASWWNPFTWSIFKKKPIQTEQQVAVENVSVASSTLQNTQKNDLNVIKFQYAICI